MISPAIGGIVIGQEVGRALGCRTIFAERENGALQLRRGFSIEPGELAVVVEDVITTGGSTLETMEVVKSRGGESSGSPVCDRSKRRESQLGTHYHSLWTLNIPTFDAEHCPLCKAGSSPVKPGSRAAVKS